MLPQVDNRFRYYLIFRIFQLREAEVQLANINTDSNNKNNINNNNNNTNNKNNTNNNLSEWSGSLVLQRILPKWNIMFVIFTCIGENVLFVRKASPISIIVLSEEILSGLYSVFFSSLLSAVQLVVFLIKERGYRRSK